MSFNVCCVPGCAVTHKDDILHRFPRPEVENERFHTWVSKIGSSVIGTDETFIYKTRRVCRKHFEAEFLYPKNRLCKLAVPTLFMAGAIEATDDVQPPADSVIVQPTSSALLDNTNCHQTDSTQSNIEEPDLSSPTPQPSCASVPMEVTRHCHTGETETTAEERELNQTIHKLKVELQRVKREIYTFQKKLEIARRASIRKPFEIVARNMTKTSRTFLRMQLTQAGKKSRGRRFDLNEKALALSLYNASPRAYQLLGQICVLPDRRTLER